MARTYRGEDGILVIELDLPPAPEAPDGYVIIRDGCKTYHRPYRYISRWNEGEFKSTPHCSTGIGKEWTLVIEAEAYANAYKKCRNC